MKEIIRICNKHNLDFAAEVRRFVSKMPKDEKSGVYSYSKDSGK